MWPSTHGLSDSRSGVGLCGGDGWIRIGGTRGDHGHDSPWRWTDRSGGNALNGLGFAAFVLLAWRPGDLFDVGFQLSFGATGGILLFYKPIRNVFPAKDRTVGRVLLDPLVVSVASQVGTMPILMKRVRRGFHRWLGG